MVLRLPWQTQARRICVCQTQAHGICVWVLSLVCGPFAHQLGISGKEHWNQGALQTGHIWNPQVSAESCLFTGYGGWWLKMEIHLGYYRLWPSSLPITHPSCAPVCLLRPAVFTTDAVYTVVSHCACGVGKKAKVKLHFQKTPWREWKHSDGLQEK